jgi:hypothetical protein
MTTTASKERMMAYFKDYFERGMMKLFSMDLVEEMKSIVRDQGTITAYGRGKDDRVMAGAMAAAAYAEQVWPRLVQARITRTVSHAQQEHTPEQLAVSSGVGNYLKKIGVFGAR